MKASKTSMMKNCCKIIKELIEERYNTGRSTIKLSSARMSDLRKAKQDIDAGNVHSDEDVNRWIEAWLRA